MPFVSGAGLVSEARPQSRRYPGGQAAQPLHTFATVPSPRKLLRYLRRGLIPPKRFFPGMGEAAITPEGIHLRDYPFAPSVVHPERLLTPADIASVTFGTPLLLQVGDDFVFVSREREAALRVFAKAHRIPERPVNYNWSFLLDPYLDTDSDDDDRARGELRLTASGIPPAEVAAIRDEVGGPMAYYNFGLMVWEWTFFTLYDVVCVMHACVRPAAFADFYARATAVERRGDRPEAWSAPADAP